MREAVRGPADPCRGMVGIISAVAPIPGYGEGRVCASALDIYPPNT